MALQKLKGLNGQLLTLLKNNDLKNSKIKQIIKQLKMMFYGGMDLQNESKEILMEARTFTELNLFYVLTQGTKSEKQFDMAIKNVQYFYENNLQLPKSNDHYQVRAIHLLLLLSSNRNQQFYSKLQNLTPEELNNPYIQYVLKINDAIEEGNYRRVFTLRKQNTIQYVNVFLDKISQTVRIEIAKSSQKAYSLLSIQDALNVFQVENEGELKKFIQRYKENQVDEEDNHVKWQIEKNEISFIKHNKNKVKFNSQQLIKTSLFYAGELEKIA